MTLDQARKMLGGKFWLSRFRPGYFKVECAYDGCSASWSISGKGLDHPGNVLHLLNHYAGHERPQAEKDAERKQKLGASRRMLDNLNRAIADSGLYE